MQERYCYVLNVLFQEEENLFFLSEILLRLSSRKKFKAFLLNSQTKWEFILEKSPWWGGFYERLINIIKNCLKKVIGKSFSNYEEVNTALIDVKQLLNSQPSTYLKEDNIEEALPTFHLLYVRNVKIQETLIMTHE